MDTKKCSKCGEVKGVDEFSKRKASRDGYRHTCSNCSNLWSVKYREKNKDKINTRSKEYRKKNPDRTKYYNDKHRKENPEYASKYYKENKEKIKVIAAKYRKENAEKIKVRAAKYHKENKEEITERRKCHIRNKDREKEMQIKYRKENAEKIKVRAAKYYKENKEEITERILIYRKENKNKLYKTMEAWRKKNKEKCKEYQRIGRKRNIKKIREKARIRYEETKLHCNTSRLVYKSLKGEKNNRMVFSILEYTEIELKQHIQSQFTDGMSWDNYGEWHVDHIVPQCIFNFKKSNDIEFKQCWSLKNLQPLWAKENLSKSNRIGPEWGNQELYEEFFPDRKIS